MKVLNSVVIAALLFAVSCASTKEHDGRDTSLKIEFDLTQLDPEGLRGPPDGKVAVSYEFCIPNTDDCKAQVRAIDRTVEFMPGSRGRIGATKEQCLCIGSTHQTNYRAVLFSLAKLPYIERVIECHFE